MLSDRVFVREELPDELLVYHRGGRSVRIVGVREGAASLEWDSECSKVAARNNPKLGERTLFGGLGLPSTVNDIGVLGVSKVGS
jgi:hypothetical protein